MSRSGAKHNRVVVVLAFLLMVVGSVFLLSPVIGNMLFTHKASAEIQEVDRLQNLVSAADDASADESAADAPEVQQLIGMRDQLQAYNDQVAAGRRTLAGDPFAFSAPQSGFDDASAFADAAVGVVEIPAMDCTLPLYLGASYEHMARGATVVEGSSAPLGGASTNCVIAGHRGWDDTAMFRDIERLKVGDAVKLRTVWGNLSYTVAGIRIISPNDTQAVSVREGLDLVTLVTCHPYGYNYQRYVVFCVRDGSPAPDGEVDENTNILGTEGVSNGGEERTLEAILGNPVFEDVLRMVGVAALIACFCMAVWRSRKNR